jgi:excisionase family DNA binding protein
MEKKENNAMMTVNELAQRWSMAPLTIRRLISSGKLPAYRILLSGPQRAVRIKLSDVIDYEETR